VKEPLLIKFRIVFLYLIEEILNRIDLANVRKNSVEGFYNHQLYLVRLGYEIEIEKCSINSYF
jgi:hypothetical protein